MNDAERITLLERQLAELAARTMPDAGTCDWGSCDREAWAYRWSAGRGWLPACRDHLTEARHA